MKKNHIIKSFRVSKKTKELLEEASQELSLSQTDLIRFLLNKSLVDLKSDSQRAKGYQNLSITLKELR